MVAGGRQLKEQLEQSWGKADEQVARLHRAAQQKPPGEGSAEEEPRQRPHI